MRRLLCSSAIGLVLGFFLPAPGPDTVFVYKSAHAQAGPGPTSKSIMPDWIQSSCCGAQDAHKLRVDQVHRRDENYYLIDGYVRPVPAKQALPSQDGDYWIFYRDDGAMGQSGVYCFFIPMEF